MRNLLDDIWQMHQHKGIYVFEVTVARYIEKFAWLPTKVDNDTKIVWLTHYYKEWKTVPVTQSPNMPTVYYGTWEKVSKEHKILNEI